MVSMSSWFIFRRLVGREGAGCSFSFSPLSQHRCRLWSTSVDMLFYRHCLPDLDG